MRKGMRGMLTIFNRVELYVTTDIGKQTEIREALAHHGIDYKLVIRNPAADRHQRTRTGTFGQHGVQMNEYCIYVHKKDYEQAQSVIHGIECNHEMSSEREA